MENWSCRCFMLIVLFYVVSHTESAPAQDNVPATGSAGALGKTSIEKTERPSSNSQKDPQPKKDTEQSPRSNDGGGGGVQSLDRLLKKNTPPIGQPGAVSDKLTDKSSADPPSKPKEDGANKQNGAKVNQDPQPVKKVEDKVEKKEEEDGKDEDEKKQEPKSQQQTDGQPKAESKGDEDPLEEGDDEEELGSRQELTDGIKSSNEKQNKNEQGDQLMNSLNTGDFDFEQRDKSNKNTKPEDLKGRPIDTKEEAESSGSFMTIFVVCAVLVVTLYIAFHNRHKILAYLVEGRRSRSTGRRRGASGSSGAEYRQLNNSSTADDQL